MRMIVLGLCAALLAPSAMAQEWVVPSIWGNGILGQQALRNAADNVDAYGDTADAKKRARERLTAPTLPYSRSGRLTGEVEAAVAAKLPQIVSLRMQIKDPSYFVTGGESRTHYKRELDTRDFPRDSFAGATAVFLAVGWEQANGAKLSAAQNAAILRQTIEMMKSTPQAKQGDAQRQEQAEMRLLVTGIWAREAKLRADAPGQLRALSDSVWRDMKTITNNDMRSYVVTAQGFSER
ncbi:MAG: hypothetical protein EOP61_25365 [Sphingomonadales bacterium]|nr:MAG: hypothetical protein EOP61_25365 [Sphingomonadales bacterium]